jgi:competence protein ComGC
MDHDAPSKGTAHQATSVVVLVVVVVIVSVLLLGLVVTPNHVQVAMTSQESVAPRLDLVVMRMKMG